MATIEDWNKYYNLLHELALIEDDLREVQPGVGYAAEIAKDILWERFGVQA